MIVNQYNMLSNSPITRDSIEAKYTRIDAFKGEFFPKGVYLSTTFSRIGEKEGKDPSFETMKMIDNAISSERD